ncbi:putative mitochondrial protein [Vitis vinifera]|uniref:Putative mitochondrial protein n=1 Tax=Vitis vinifera TaxID=29760 RepID=A0A438C6K4_VITVI|nr:putative mitochondrial protein [Vitis vinifera]
MHAPTEDHFHALKRILRYVKGTPHHGLQLHQQSTHDILAYSDADWAGVLIHVVPLLAITGYAIFFCTNLVSCPLRSKALSLNQLADSLTKGVTKPQFFLFQSKLNVIPSPTLTLQGGDKGESFDSPSDLLYPNSVP